MKGLINLSRKGRALLAMALWLFAGLKVLYIAVDAYNKNLGAKEQLLWFVVALIFFSGLVFPKAVPPNVEYIRIHPEPRPFYYCLRPLSWLIMPVMMTLGITLRLFRLTSEEFIVGFYMGLGLSLLLCVRFYFAVLIQFIKEERHDR